MENEYTITPDNSFYENILTVYRMHMKEDPDYINPNMLVDILQTLEAYNPDDDFCAPDEVWDWVKDMYGM